MPYGRQDEWGSGANTNDDWGESSAAPNGNDNWDKSNQGGYSQNNSAPAQHTSNEAWEQPTLSSKANDEWGQSNNGQGRHDEWEQPPATKSHDEWEQPGAPDKSDESWVNSNTSQKLDNQMGKPASSGWGAPVDAPNESHAPAPIDTNAEPDKDSSSAPKPVDTTNSVVESGIHEPEYDVAVKLSDLQADPNDPLFSAKSFEELGLDENILKGLYQMRFTKPSKIQERALPLLLHNPPTNMIGQSQSGTGKTAAFVLNILSRIDVTRSDGPQALVLAPSRELARQILGVVQVMGKFLDGLQVDAAIPVDMASRGRQFRGHVVVGTPGTVGDMIRRRLLNPTNIKVLVLDEADNMLDQQGLGDQCQRVRMYLPEELQVVLFSATFPSQVVAFAAEFAPNSNQITLKHEELTVEGIKQLYLECDSEEAKYEALVRLYGLMTIGSSIIFVRTRDTAHEIEQRLNAEGHKVASLTGAYDGGQRDHIIDAFRTGKAKVLITTNVLSRGIDVQTVSLVVNYDLPQDGRGTVEPQVYLHRIGRTGRFGRIGVAINLVYGEDSMYMITQLQQYFGIEMMALPREDWDAVERVIKRVIKSSRATADFNRGGQILVE